MQNPEKFKRSGYGICSPQLKMCLVKYTTYLSEGSYIVPQSGQPGKQSAVILHKNLNFRQAVSKEV